jgi:hypothetical protein
MIAAGSGVSTIPFPRGHQLVTLEERRQLARYAIEGIDPQLLSPPLQPGGILLLHFVRTGDLLALPLQPLVSRSDRFRWPGKSSGPPPFAPSLNIQGDDTHNNSEFSFAALNRQIASRSRANGSGHNCVPNKFSAGCWNLITPSRSCRGSPPNLGHAAYNHYRRQSGFFRDRR